MSPLPEIVLGSPGCGKTTALIGEVERELAAGTPPDRIGYVSFTRRAAEEAVTRACARFRLAPRQLPHFRTLHSLCFRALGLTSHDVLVGARVREFADLARIRFTGRRSEDGSLLGYEPGDRMLHLENLARVRCEPLRATYDGDPDSHVLGWREVERVAAALAQFKLAHGLLDFTDMLSQVLASPGVAPRLDVLVVDEGQDQSVLQWRVVSALAARARRVVVGADDDQCIFRWAGASAEALVDMEGQVRVLGQSYRVPAVVQVLAAEVISAVRHRRPKTWAPRGAAGTLDRAVDLGDVDWGAQWVDEAQPGGEVARRQPVLVLARNTYVLRDQVEPELRRAGVLYEWADRPSLDPGLVDAVVSWEHIRSGGSVAAAAVRGVYALMTPGRGVSPGHRDLPGVPDDAPLRIDDLERQHGLLTRALWSEALDRVRPADVDYVVAARQRGERLRSPPRVRLSTVHAAKGGEARHVVLMREMARRTHDEMLASADGEDDERRVWYVAVTRARERLTVVEPTRAEACPWV